MNANHYAPNPEDLPPGCRPVQQFAFQHATLRDELAMRATDGDIADVIGNVFDPYHLARILGISFESVRDDYYGSRFKARIKARYIWADAMLAERNKT